MLEWLLKNSGEFMDIMALGTMIAGGGLYVVRLLMLSKKRFDALQKNVEEIVTQLKPNGGHSMFDMVKQAYKQSQENSQTLSNMQASVNRVHAYQWSFAETITDKPIWESDAKGQCTRVNIAYARIAERTTAELTGSGWENFLHPEDRSRVFDEWTDAISRKRIFESEFRTKSRSGKNYMVKAVALPVFSESNELIAYIGRYDKVEAMK